jgi:hypothetical protein
MLNWEASIWHINIELRVNWFLKNNLMIESGDCVANELEDRTLMMSGSSKLLVFLSRKYTGFELNFKIFYSINYCSATLQIER